MCEDWKLVDEPKPTPWGFWPTIGFSCIIGVVYFFVQIIVVAVFAVVATVRTPNFNLEQFTKGLESNGFFLSIIICATAPFNVGLIVLFARIRRGIRVTEYLCLRKLGWKEYCVWAIVLLVFVGFLDALTYLTGRPIVPQFMTDTYKTAYFTPLLWFAFVIVAPLVEELYFRGFLFTGIEHSKVGPAGAVIITSLLWSVMHIQYDIYGVVNLFVGGLLLGIARLKSKSIYPPIVMHIIQNIVATVETIIYLRIFSSTA